MLSNLKDTLNAVTWVLIEALRFLVGPIIIEEQQPARINSREKL